MRRRRTYTRRRKNYATVELMFKIFVGYLIYDFFF